MTVTRIPGPTLSAGFAGGDGRELLLAEWLTRADAKLSAQAERADRYTACYEGDLEAPTILSTQQRTTFRKLLRQAKANWAELVVNAVAERLHIVGFRFAGAAGDAAAQRIWQANQMDADHEMAQTDALVCGHAYALVQADEDNPAGVSITGEHPSQMTVLYAPGSRRRRVAAYKRFIEGDVTTGVLILPDVIVTYERTKDRPVWGEPIEVEANPAGRVPVVELRPAPRTVGAPRSELKSVLPIQDRINATIFNRLVATDYGAFRQIYATGLKIPRRTVKDDDGTTREVRDAPFDVGADRLLVNENPDGHFGVFAESTLAGYINAVAADVQHLAAITQTPPHYLLAGITNVSGDALKAAETGLVAKVSRRAAHLGEGWEEVMRLAFATVGDTERAGDVEAEVMWRDFESRSEGETVDALVKMRTLEVPLEVLWQRWGATPQEITRWQTMRAAEQTSAARVSAAALGAVDPYAQLLGAAGNA